MEKIKGGNMQQQDKNMMIVLAFIAGVMVGANWPKIKKVVEPFLHGMTDKVADVYATVAKFMAEQKETVQDKVAVNTMRKKQKKTRPRKRKGSLKVSV
jgi:hypothetical protein